MCEDAPTRRMLHPILNALVERNLLLCVGPLVAEAAGLDSPATLILHGINALGVDHPGREELAALLAAGEVARALAHAEELLAGPRFVRLLRAGLEQQNDHLPLVARAIARLSPQLRDLCTTNLDSLLERALGFKWPAFDTEPPDLWKRPRSIMKLCGSVDQVSSWVVTERRLAARPAELPLVGCMLRSHVLLLVGYRADDELLRRLVLPLRGRMDPSWRVEGPGNLALVPVDSVTPAARAFFDDHGIELVPIVGDYDVGAAQWLHGLAAACEDATRKRLPANLDDSDDLANRFCIPDPPYPGLRSYEGRGSPFHFCGRERDVERALEQLRARPTCRWLIVHGEDGVGKSSFVAAGLLPRILRDAASATRGRGGWEALRGGSGVRPLRSLAEGLCSLHRSKPGFHSWSEGALFEHLRTTAHALSDLIEQASPGGFALVIDSLDFGLDDTDRAELEAFAAALAYALAFIRVPFLLITTHRSNRLSELYRLPQLHERTLGLDPPVYYGLGPLGIDQLRQVILRPAARAGVSVPERFVTRIVADYERLMGGSQPPSAGLALAMFNAALAESLRRSDSRELSIAAYEAAGGLEGAIDSGAESALARVAGDWPEAAVRLLILALIGTDREGRALRQSLSSKEAARVMMPAFARYGPAQLSLAERMIARIAAQDGVGRLLDVSRTRIHLYHDALLSHWTRLRQWRAAVEVTAAEKKPRVPLAVAPATRLSPDLSPPDPMSIARRASPIAGATQARQAEPICSTNPTAVHPVRPLRIVQHVQATQAEPPESLVETLMPRTSREWFLLILVVGVSLFIGRASLAVPTSRQAPPGAQASATETPDEAAPIEPPPATAPPPRVEASSPAAAAADEQLAAMALAQQLVARAGRGYRAQERLANELLRLGDEALATNATSAAVAYFSRELQVSEALLKRDPGEPAYAWNAALAHDRLAMVHERLGSPALVLDHLQSAAGRLRRVKKPALARFTADPGGKTFYDRLHRQLADLSTQTLSAGP